MGKTNASEGNNGDAPSGTARLDFPGDALAQAVSTPTTDLITVGRGEENTYVLTDPRVSRLHAQLERRAGMTVIEDLGSTAGTTVNGEALDGPRMLEHGDEIGFGPVSCTFMDPSLADMEGEDTTVLAVAEVQTGPQLSPRQGQVLELIAEGMTNKEIGEQLGVTERTVKAYAGEIYTKLGVSNRAGAVAEGIKHGMLPGA